tara:strand:+ start:37 stop:663 length:627 start_codon:yes stop_codon:yes gene_type:complete
MSNTLHIGDLPDDVTFGPVVAVDTETLGLNPHRDRLCLVQLSAGDGTCHLVQLNKREGSDIDYSAPNLKRLLANPNVLKLFHYARFDIATLYHHLEIQVQPIYCTKIVSRLTRTYTDHHGLKDLCRELLDIDLSKQQQSSDWGAPELSEAQLNYAAQDVLHLHRLKQILDTMLDRESRREIANACFTFLPTRAALDLQGWPDIDIFAH